MVRECLLEGDFLAKGWRFSCDFFLLLHPWTLEEFELELILCETQLRQKIAASENRTSESRRTEKGFQAQSLMFIHFRLFSRKIPRKNQLRQKIAASERRTSDIRTSESRRTKTGLQAHPLSIAKLEIA